ncbi:MAG: hypothetical protein M1812_002913 [Candelaria pacifica]|nr:MAG: hypothetical protein M1812_002913 [Candelaria pacifica]
MSSDDQYFLDILSNIPNDVKKYSDDIADAVERLFDSIAAPLKETSIVSAWRTRAIESTFQPKPPSPPPVPLGYYGWAQNWVSRNKALTAAIFAFVGTGSFLVYRRRKQYVRKRRAGRASNGARRDVVVIAGSPNEPITTSLSLDLERRGFIVFVVVRTLEEEQVVYSESRVDIRPLNLNVLDPSSSQSAIESFTKILSSPHHAFPGASPHHLNLAGVILIPDMIYPAGPIETITPDLWSDALNIKVLGTIATTQALLQTICDFKARLLFLTPNIIPSLSPPFHGVETSIIAALEGFTNTLSSELATMGINVCQLKLGTFDCGSVGGRSHLQSSNATGADVLTWPATTRASYAKNYFAQANSPGNRGAIGGVGVNIKGSPLRELHNSVFDALTVSRPRRVWHVGKGSLAYDLVGKWVPRGIVGWMLGVRKMPPSQVGTSPAMSVRTQSPDEQEEVSDASVEWERIERRAK